MKKINILQLITGLGVGGAERVVLDLSKNINKDKFDIFVISLSQKDEMLEEYKKNQINVKALKKDNSLKSFIEIVLFLNTFIKKNQIDIIHAHMTHSVIIASIVKILNPKVKIVFTSHSINMESKIREIILYLLKPFRVIDILFSKEQKSFFYVNNLKYIPNGIDISLYEINTEKNALFTFISVGRLAKEKNHSFLIEVLKDIPKKYNFQVLLVGDGVLREKLEQLSKKYNVENRIKFLGLRKDIPILLNKAHCFIMPSLWEGLPIALLEAGAAKLPVIAPPVGSIPLVLNNENSFLVKYDNFKDIMMRVMDDYNTALKKGNKLYKTIKNSFSIEATVKQHEQIYLDVLTKV